MDPLQKETNERSNNAGANGNVFQIAVAIVAFARYRDRLCSIGIEAGEDIDVNLRNGKTVYIQCKSSYKKIGEKQGQKITDALLSLSRHKTAEELICAFNFIAPFKSDKDVLNFNQILSPILFNDLQEESKEDIKKRCKRKRININFYKIHFWRLNWRGEDKMQITADYLRNTFKPEFQREVEDYVYISLNDRLFRIFSENATDDKRNVGLETLLGAMLDEILWKPSPRDLILQYIGITDLFEKERILRFFSREELQKISCDFKSYIKIVTLYQEFRETAESEGEKPFDRFFSFVKEKLELSEYFETLFAACGYDSKRLADKAEQFFVALVIYKYQLIQKVRSIFNYED